MAIEGAGNTKPQDTTARAAAQDQADRATVARKVGETAGAAVNANSGAMDFIANATSSIFFESWTPDLQKLVGGRITPEQLLKNAQAFWAKSQ